MHPIKEEKVVDATDRVLPERVERKVLVMDRLETVVLAAKMVLTVRVENVSIRGEREEMVKLLPIREERGREVR